jgi:hypothetical protein
VLESPTPVRASIPDYELPASWREPEPVGEAEIPVIAAEPAPVQSAVELEPEPAQPPIASRPLQIPVYHEPEGAEIAYELMPTSAPPLGEIELPREPQLEETAADATRSTVADIPDPGLLPHGQQFEPVRISAEAIVAAEMAPLDVEFMPGAGFQDIPTEISSHLPPPGATEAHDNATAEEPAADAPADVDFEARVAAALAAYGHNQDAPTAVSQAVPSQFGSNESVVTPAAPAGITREIVASGAQEISGPPPILEMETISTTGAVTAPEVPVWETARPRPVPMSAESVIADGGESSSAFEYRAPVGVEHGAPVDAPAGDISGSLPPATAEFVAEQPDAALPTPQTLASDPRSPLSQPPSPVLEAVITDTRESLITGIEDALPPAAASADSGSSHQAIAQAVHRVMERLKPELVEEILRELKSKNE